jgi:lysyl-tRNA synthetase, class II
MATVDKIRKIRAKKAEMIKKSLFNPYPQKTKRTHCLAEALGDFTKLFCSKKRIILVGRIKSLRVHGGSSFMDIEDGTGKIQTFLKKDGLGEKSYDTFLKVFDVGDFVELKGILFKTKRGEKTLKVDDYKMLTKSLLPLPEKWHGLKDAEERFRKRYLDLIFNSEVKNKFEQRGKIIKEIRNFLDKEGFLEVETPILQHIYGGAKASPFKTYLNAQKLNLYLRISLELYLKRLLVGGFEKVYEIGKCFRNEGMDRSHNPDFTMLEFYWAYADYKKMMKLTEKMFKSLLKKVFRSYEIEYQGKKINFKTPWPRVEFEHLLKRYTKINLEEINLESLKKEAYKLGVTGFDKNAGKNEIADEIYKKYCLPKIWNPTFVINHPLGFFPLAKTREKDPNKLSNFQLIIAGWELVNAFSELNDPIEQRKRFEEQEKLFNKGFEEAQRMDKDFLDALEYGMPPAAGFGMGIDRLVALLTDSHSLREVIFFPMMKPKETKTKK